MESLSGFSAPVIIGGDYFEPDGTEFRIMPGFIDAKGKSLP
jgi:hypothetical protein